MPDFTLAAASSLCEDCEAALFCCADCRWCIYFSWPPIKRTHFAVCLAVRAPLCKVGTMGSSPVRPQRTWPVPGRNYRRVGEMTNKERKKWIDKHGQRKVAAAAEIRR